MILTWPLQWALFFTIFMKTCREKNNVFWLFLCEKATENANEQNKGVDFYIGVWASMRINMVHG